MSENTLPETPDFPEVPGGEYIPTSEPNKNGDSGKDWMAIVSLVAGVLSLCGLIFAPVGCFFSLAAIVFGILGLKANLRVLAIIGLIIGGIGVVISLIFGAIMVLGLMGPSIGSTFEEIITELESGY